MKDIHKYFKQLEALGWTVNQTNKKMKLRSPKGSLVTCSITPSCPFALKHIRNDVKKVGLRDGVNYNELIGA